MRTALTLALAAVLAGSPAFGRLFSHESNNGGSIEVLVRATNGTPLDDVDVRLTGPQDALVTTARDGRAFFNDLTPGRYWVSAIRHGYVMVDPDGSGTAQATASVQIESPQSSSDTPLALASAARQVRFTLTQGAILTGRVQDHKGRPIDGVKISIARITIQYGRRIVGKVSPSVNVDVLTNDLGEFRVFWLPPGEYLVLANGLFGGDKREDYQPTFYYPGTVDVTMAGKLILKEGEEIRADFTAPENKGVTISGTFVSPESEGSSRVSLFVGSAAPELTLPIELRRTILASSPDDRTFEVRQVPAGSYYLGAETSGGGSTRFWGQIKIEVGSSNVSGLVIALDPHDTDGQIRGRFSLGANVEAHVRRHPAFWIDGEDDSRPKLAATLEATDALRQERIYLSTGGDGQKDLEFSKSQVSRGQYRLISVAARLPADGYLADVRQNGRSIYNDGVVNVGREPVDLEFVMEDGGGSIEGSVLFPSGVESPASLAIVLLPEKPQRGNLLLYKRLNLSFNSDGPATFAFRGVPPGNYRILAYDFLLRGEEWNPDLIARDEQRGVAVTIGHGVRLSGIQTPLRRTR